MAENFLDNIIYANSTLGVSGDAVAIGSTNAGAKSVIFNTSNTAGHLAWLPTANRTLNLPDGSGTLITNVNLSAGTTSNNLTAMVFSNANGVSFGLNGSTVTASVQAGAAAGIGAVGAGTQTQTSGTLIFSNSNGMTFGMSNSSVITGSYTVPSIAGLISAVNFSAGTTSNNATAFVFSNSNNVSFGLNGSTITATITVPTQTNQTLGLFATSNTTQNSSTTLDARSLTIQGAGIASVGYSNGSIIVSVPSGAPSPVNFSAGTTSGNLGSVVFSNSNGISFGLNGSTITASVAGGGGSLSLFALGNTTQNSSSNVGVSSVSFNALGAMTMGFSNGSIQVSAPPVTSVVGLGGIILSTNGSTLSISGANFTNYEPFPIQTSTTSFVPGAGTWVFQPFQLDGNMSGGRLNRLFVMGSNNSTGLLSPTSSASFSSNSTGSRSVSYSYINSIALYSLGSGTNSTRLESIWSNTISFGINQSVSVSTNGATTLAVTNAATLSYIISIDSNGAYTTTSISGSTNRTTAAGSMGFSSVTAALSSLVNILSGSMILPIGFNTTIAPGNYWMAQCWSSASTTGGTAANVFPPPGLVAQTIPELNTIYRVMGQTANATNSQIFPGGGAYSVTSAAPPATIAFSQIISLGSAVRQYFNWVNSTI